jgi:hypothetical protein
MICSPTRADREAILKGMAVWFEERPCYGRFAPPMPAMGPLAEPVPANERTPERRAWDSALLAAMEYLRRLHGYHEFTELLDLQTRTLP